jgi:hypothetical protein
MVEDDGVGVRDFSLTDIEPMLDYWLAPENRAYHLLRGTDPAVWIDPERERRALGAVVETPPPERRHSAAVVTRHGQAVGHVLLNDVQDDVRRRLHFHMWRRKIERTSLTDTLRLTKIMARCALRHFFEAHAIDTIIGDIAVSNRPANFALRSMGIKPFATVEEEYLGIRQPYHRYVFSRAAFTSP